MPQDKEYLLKEQTAEATYQKKLTAGQNIVISPDNVISALGSTAPPTNVTVTPKTLSGENIADMTVNGTTYHLYSSYPRIMTGATTASAGQSGYVPTPYSTDKDYVLYGSGEWKDPHVPVITANPAGSTTTTLNKLYLDGTIYGIAGGGGGSGSTVSITPTFADGVKIADYEIDGTSGVLKIPVKELTQTEYDALPSTKLTDNIVYYISGTRVLDPDYTYHTWGENDEIVVRVYHEGESDENIIWFFNGWNQTVLYETIPSSLASYAPDYDAGVVLSANYPNGGTVQDGWIGFYQSTIRAWNQGKGENVTGIKYGVVIVTNGAAEQLNPYEDDPYIWISSSINKIIINGTEYGNTGAGSNVSITPSLTTGTKIADYEIDGVSGELFAPSGGGGGTTTTYYITDGQISDGPNQQFLTVQLTTPLEEAQGYVMVFKNTSGGTTVHKEFFNYLYDTAITIYGGSSIGNASMYLTSTAIQCTNYTGPWQDIYIDVYRKIPTAALELEYYLTNGLVGAAGGSYVTCMLDENMDNGYYIIILKDGNDTFSNSLLWTGSTISTNIGSNYTIEITSTTAGLTYYTGSYRNIYADIIKVASF